MADEDKKESKLPNVKLPTIKLPKLPKAKEIPSIMKRKFKEYSRVLKITKKPDRQEFISIVKITGLGTIIIGAIGFAIFMAIELLK